MRITHALILASLVGASAGAQVITDPDNGHYYEVVSSPGTTWLADEINALGMYYSGLEGHLATVTSSDENNFVTAAVVAANLGEVYVGGYQNPQTETTPTAGWTWVNGEGTFPGVNGASGYLNSYSDWNGGEPNDAYGAGSEQWLAINFAGGWNDEGYLGNITGYVVEFDPNTETNGGLAPGYAPDGGCTLAMMIGAVTLLGGLSRRLRK